MKFYNGYITAKFRPSPSLKGSHSGSKMVSIPDWTKFSRIHDTQKEASTLSNLDRYYRQREEETIKQAESQGILKVPSQDYLVKQCGPLNGSNKPVKDVFQLKFVRLTGVHLRKIGDLTHCVNLRICLLGNNFLTKIDGLASCRQLVKLDLHGNQLTSIPGIAFWSGLRRLKFLHLHDNPLGKYETLQNLATCPHLVALTLYDTPLSLKRNYRHHVVNSVWSLKALDNYVVSDEEIIEDAVFGGKFAAKSAPFRINLHYQTTHDVTFPEEMKILLEIERRINNVLSKHSPVLIVQKFTKGYLTRKHQKRLRKIKSAGGTTLPLIQSDQIPPPPSSSPVLGRSPSGQEVSINDTVSVDYDSYMKNRRPESTAPSETTTMSHTRTVPGETTQSYQGPFPTPMDGVFIAQPPGTPIDLGTEIIPKKKKNLLINLAKLQSGTFSSLYDEQIAIETVLPSDSLERAETDLDMKKKRRKRMERIPQRRFVKSVKQFFGPVVETSGSDKEEVEPTGDDEELPITQFRLRGYKPDIILIDPMTEMIITKQESGRLVRDAEVEHQRRKQEVTPPKPKVLTKKSTNTDQRIFSRVHGTMGMSCLYAVHQAYKDREKAERTAAKMEHILTMREERYRAKERIRLYQDEKRSSALKQRDVDKSRMLDNLERREVLRLNYLDRRNEFKNKSMDLSKSFRADYTFITEFSNQHTSVSNALMRHDRQAKYDDEYQHKSDFVKNQKDSQGDQQEVVKKYLEHRQLMRQTESAMARATLDTRMLQEASDRIMEAKARVAHQKARRETVQAFYPIPTLTPVPIAASAPPPIAHGLTRWEANVITQQGRLGKHPTVVT